MTTYEQHSEALHDGPVGTGKVGIANSVTHTLSAPNGGRTFYGFRPQSDGRVVVRYRSETGPWNRPIEEKMSREDARQLWKDLIRQGYTKW